MAEFNFTTIGPIQKRTRARLKELKGERTYQEFIAELLDVYEASRGNEG